mmetsp:Transcript_26142/g.39565  ORF Transcript_26142/g.39565 Transcript_26142/m.39565 type:complete len:187 (+) Transcript_26142:38-598(+)|eukprot:CAMPEP_0178922628 /NCGR_PEP_ID=MMETSP0786-20121207/16262_1 /TAXON_ID=186022 /ORGANISM="Thalassionema frauenfeldii, Strain CCMP 1798" /LENGTH=186 /DNA_ID=CAMNT_0020597019 /DNA_START=14 /DNA_END=574 /DNA_ORIENTATION=-
MGGAEVQILPRRPSSQYGQKEKHIPMELESFDVICDDAFLASHVGNRRISVTMSINCKRYLAAKTLSEQKSIAASVVDTVMSSYRPGGRFLKNDRNNKLVAVDRKRAIKWTQKSFERMVSDARPPAPDSVNSSAAAEDKPIDAQLAKLLIKQHEIFTMLAEKGKNKKEANKKKCEETKELMEDEES